MITRRLGEPGFASFAKVIHRLSVLSRSELLESLALHGAVIRACELPLDDGSGIEEEAFSELARLLNAAER